MTQLFELLKYGAIGLGCILAVLAYQLLRVQQNKINFNTLSSPDKVIIKINESFNTMIKLFMIFSLTMSTVGFVAEMIHSQYVGDQIIENEQKMNKKIEDMEGEIKTITTRMVKAETESKLYNDQLKEVKDVIKGYDKYLAFKERENFNKKLEDESDHSKTKKAFASPPTPSVKTKTPEQMYLERMKKILEGDKDDKTSKRLPAGNKYAG